MATTTSEDQARDHLNQALYHLEKLSRTLDAPTLEWRRKDGFRAVVSAVDSAIRELEDLEEQMNIFDAGSDDDTSSQ